MSMTASLNRHPFGSPVSSTYSLHWSSFWALPHRILVMYLVKTKKGTTMETIGSICGGHRHSSGHARAMVAPAKRKGDHN